MKKSIVIGVLVIGMSLAAARADVPGPSVCQRLVEPAMRIPAGDWIASIHDPMDRLMHVRARGATEHARPPIEERLADDPEMRAELATSPSAVLDVERLPGTDFYRVDSFQGSANCQYMRFVEAPAAGPPRRVPAPFDASPCTPQYARFGRAFGLPLFIAGGAVEMAGLARRYTISAWQGRGKGWTEPCELTLEFARRFELVGSYCSPDAALCKAAAALAPAVAAASARSPAVDPLAFAAGRPPPPALATQLGDKAGIPPEFPTFGATSRGTKNPFLTSFSNARAATGLALWIDGRWWLGVVGVAGIGWRESTTTLLVVYAITDGEPVSAASFQVETLPAGRAQAHWQ